MAKTRVSLVLSVIILAAPCLLAKETFHSLSLDAGTVLPAQGIEVGLEYAFHWFPIESLSVVQYLRLNLNAAGTLGAWAENFEAANTWAGENTLAFNLMLLGIPYFVATVVAAAQSQFLFCPGVELRYHPLRAGLIDLAVGVGVSNNPYRFMQEKPDEIPLFIYPVASASAQASLVYKALLAKAWLSYEYEILSPSYEGLNPHGFYWGASVGWRFAVRP